MRQPVPFGKYLLLDRISVGGMAEVFKAKSYGVEGFEKIIAIKRILPTMGEDRDFIKMFIDEAKIAGQLAHANICQIFELGRIDGSHFIAMEYIWGKDLLQIQNRLRKIKQPMPVSMACFVIAKVLEGLDYAHRKRDPLGRPLEIVHRDCSPQNVLVSYEGEVKVIDFGIAKATSRNSRTMAGVLKGKFGYMSPEQVRGLPLDRRSDIFALGTMLYECLTSERLFAGETDFSTLEKVRNVDIRPPREINPNIPEAVERVILKALARDVDDRYQWCSEMLGDIQQYLMSQDVVFTAKHLSGWLKEVFTNEIEKERQLLETYKRVGRDGLIQGVPAAEAKLDVVEHLGEAPAPEGDATQLGGPDFDDIEGAVGASAAVGPALGSPAAVGGSAPPSPKDDDGDFGEEAPTEIFGDLDGNGDAVPVAASAASRPSSSIPQSRPPRPPPGARPPVNGGQPAMGGMSLDAALSSDPGVQPMNPPPHAPADAYGGGAHPGGMGSPGGSLARASNQGPAAYNAPPGYPQAAGLAPVAPPEVMNALAPGGQPPNSKTLLGAAAPAGLGMYGQGNYPPQAYPVDPRMQGAPSGPISGPMSGQMPNQPGQMHGMPSGPMPTMNPSQPQMLAHPSGPMMNPSMSNMGYPSAPGYPNQYAPNNVAAVEPKKEGRRKSSIGRDITIGVVIAAVVLGGFLALKFLVLDADDDSGTGEEPASEIANLKIELKPDNVEAKLFLDGSDTAEHVVHDGMTVQVKSGDRKIKVVAKDGQVCERDLALAPDTDNVFSCELDTKTAGSGSGSGSAEQVSVNDAGSGSGSGSADDGKTDAGSGSGSAKAADAGSGAGSGSAKPDDGKTDGKTDGKPGTTGTTGTHTTIRPYTKPDKNPDAIKGRDDGLDLTGILDGKKKPDKKPPPPPHHNQTQHNQTQHNDKKPAASGDATVIVSSKPKAKLSVDGKPIGQSTPFKIKLSPGRHRIGFAWGTAKTSFPISVKAGETRSFHKDLE